MFEVFDPAHGRRVAVKHFAKAAPERRSVAEKVRALGELGAHPSLVRILGIETDSNHDRIVMELVEGSDLLSHLGASAATGGSNDLARLRHCFVQIAEALRGLHDAGLVHGDLKPENVLVTPEGRAVLIDLDGCIAFGADATRADDTRGAYTPEYAAPERLGGATVGPAADWYAFGVLLHEALTGSRPSSSERRGTGPSRAIPRESHPDPERAAIERLASSLLAIDDRERPDGAQILQHLAPDSRDDEGSGFAITDEPFVGREAELAALVAAYDAVRAKQASRVVVVGESGIGKSALVRSFLRRIAVGGTGAPIVLFGRSHVAGREAYSGLAGVLDGLARALCRLDPAHVKRMLPDDVGALRRRFPVLDGVPAIASAPEGAPMPLDPSEDERRATEAMRALVKRLCLDHHVVVALDDVQWLGFDGFSLLGQVFAHATVPTLVVCTARPETSFGDARALAEFRRFRAETSAAVVEVGPLDASETSALLAALLDGEGDPRDVATLRAETKGHPYWIEVLARTARDGRSQRGSASTLESAIGERFDELPVRLRDALAYACIALAPLASQTLADALCVDARDVPALMQDLVDARLARFVGSSPSPSIVPYHDKVRDALLSRLDDGDSKRLHLELARALEARRSPSWAVAFHYAHGGRTDCALPFALDAAEAFFRAGNFEKAADTYRELLRWTDAGDPARSKILRDLGVALELSGRGADAATCFLEAADAGDSPDAVDLRRHAAVALLASGEVERGKAAFADAIRPLGLTLPKSQRTALVRVVFARAALAFTRLEGIEAERTTESSLDSAKLAVLRQGAHALTVFDPIMGGYFAALYLRLAARARSEPHLASALGIESVGRTFMGNDRGGDRLMADAARHAERSADPYAKALVLAEWAAVHSIRKDDYAEQCTQATDAVAIFRERCRGVRFELSSALMLRRSALGFLGRYRELSDTTERDIEEARRLGNRAAFASVAGEYAAQWGYLAADAPDRIFANLAEMEQATAEVSPFQVWQVAMIRTMAFCYAGEHERAENELEGRLRALRSTLVLRAPTLDRVSAMVQSAARIHLAGTSAGDARKKLHEAVRRHAKTMLAESRRCSVGWAHARLAAIANQTGDVDGAIGSLERAIAAFEACHAFGFVAAAEVVLGTVQGGSVGEERRRRGLVRFVEQGVRDPARLADALVPGFSSGA